MRLADTRVLVFTRTAGYRHESIEAGVAALAEMVDADATEDASVFTPENLARYRVVVFLNTSGTMLDDDQRRALAAYVRDSGGFVGVHCAAATEYDWPDYGELVGAWFDHHPEVQPAVIHVADHDHPATAHLPERWEHVDEWYNFRTNPRPHVRVLLTVDEATYRGGRMGADHPIAWCRPYGRGRSFYTALGHTVESYADPAVRAHLAGGLRWAAGQA
ncbi:MAG: ThuA domain-containing protein [Micromonosporaceae bacterium]|nr:ThuA domain-containing protein [Micromonosporaceae bacterium]